MFFRLKIISHVTLMCSLLFSIHGIARSADPILPVSIEKPLGGKKGFGEDDALALLSAAHRQGLLTRGAARFPSPQCLKAKDISSQGGAKTLALFTILVSKQCLKDDKKNHDDYKVAYILKENQDKQEPYNLAMVKDDKELRQLDMAKEKDEGLPSISFHHEILSIEGKKSGDRVFSLLYAAPGKELHALVSELAKVRGDKKAGKSSEYKERKERLIDAYYQVGRALAKMQYLFMEPAGKIFGVTHAHGDLHDRNVFVDGKVVTLIDNESFIHSVKEKKPVWVDLLRLLNPVYNPKAEKHHPREFSSEDWVEISVAPFFQGYVDGFPKDKREKVIDALSKMFLKDSPATDKIEEQYGAKHLKDVRSDYLEPALSTLR